MTTVGEYGSWKSRITPDLFTKCACKSYCEVQVVGNTLFWVEQNAATGKRELYSQSNDNNTPLRWADGQSIQTAIHEYGGGALHVLPDGSVIFATIEGLFHQTRHNEPPVKLADGDNRKQRFGDCSSTDTHVFCVHESHTENEKFPENRLVSIDRNTKEQKVIASGADFYAYPRISPDGGKLVWVEWKHPNMPWDETTIRIASVDGEGRTRDEKILRDGNGKRINYQEPSWISNEKLFMINDSTNWWNVYEVALESDKERNVNPVKREIGYPLWQLGFRNFAANSRYLVMIAGDRLHLRINSDDSVVEIPTPEFTVFSYLSIDETSERVYAIASGPKRASSIISINLSERPFQVTVHRESRDSKEIDNLDISEPEEIWFKSDGVDVSGFFYPPRNSDYSAPDGTLPPVLLLGHGGPTAPAQNCLDLKKQFFTSRGIAVFDVNYRGSTGFGTEFRRMLYKNCCIVDRNDMLNGAKMLIERGLVDGDKVMINGSSSGGLLLLSCLLSPDNIISAAVSLYGVADILALDEDTHKFEQSYNQLLLGKYPEEAALYAERSPINHIDRINTPIAFMHGKEDTVVPVGQSIAMFEKLRRRGIPTALMLFENEGHGFRGGDAIRESTESAFYFLTKVMGIEPSVDSKLEIVNSPSRL